MARCVRCLSVVDSREVTSVVSEGGHELKGVKRNGAASSAYLSHFIGS